MQESNGKKDTSSVVTNNEIEDVHCNKKIFASERVEKQEVGEAHELEEQEHTYYRNILKLATNTGTISDDNT